MEHESKLNSCSTARSAMFHLFTNGMIYACAPLQHSDHSPAVGTNKKRAGATRRAGIQSHSIDLYNGYERVGAV